MQNIDIIILYAISLRTVMISIMLLGSNTIKLSIAIVLIYVRVAYVNLIATGIVFNIRASSSHIGRMIRLSTLRPVANDLLNDALRLDNELSALAATCSLRSMSKVQINHLGLQNPS